MRVCIGTSSTYVNFYNNMQMQRNLTFSWEMQKKEKKRSIIHKTIKVVKPSSEANPDRSLIGVLISLRTTTSILSHGGERLTLAPCAPKMEGNEATEGRLNLWMNFSRLEERSDRACQCLGAPT